MDAFHTWEDLSDTSGTYALMGENLLAEWSSFNVYVERDEHPNLQVLDTIKQPSQHFFLNAMFLITWFRYIGCHEYTI